MSARSLPGSTPEHVVEPARVVPDGLGVGAKQPLDARVDQDHLDVGEGDERLDEGPRPGSVEVLRVGAREPLVSLGVEVADVDVAPRLMAHVRRERAAVSSADVADVGRRRVGELRVHRVDAALDEVHRLAGAPGIRGVDAFPAFPGGHLHAVEERSGTRASDRHRPELRRVFEQEPSDLFVGSAVEGMLGGGSRRLGDRRFVLAPVIDGFVFVFCVGGYRGEGGGAGATGGAALGAGLMGPRASLGAAGEHETTAAMHAATSPSRRSASMGRTL